MFNCVQLPYSLCRTCAREQVRDESLLRKISNLQDREADLLEKNQRLEGDKHNLEELVSIGMTQVTKGFTSHSDDLPTSEMSFINNVAPPNGQNNNLQHHHTQQQQQHRIENDERLLKSEEQLEIARLKLKQSQQYAQRLEEMLTAAQTASSQARVMMTSRFNDVARLLGLGEMASVPVNGEGASDSGRQQQVCLFVCLFVCLNLMFPKMFFTCICVW